MNINQWAASIELYLGKDVLTKDGNLIPIQWTGYKEKLRRYHGEIIDKSYVQSKFKEKIKDCEKHPEHINNYDWEGILIIWEKIFNLCYNLNLDLSS